MLSTCSRPPLCQSPCWEAMRQAQPAAWLWPMSRGGGRDNGSTSYAIDAGHAGARRTEIASARRWTCDRPHRIAPDGRSGQLIFGHAKISSRTARDVNPTSSRLGHESAHPRDTLTCSVRMSVGHRGAGLTYRSAARSALCGQRLVTERDRPAESPPRRWCGLPIMRFGGGPPGIWLGRSRTASSGPVNALSCTSMRSADSRASPASRLSR